jgi:phosphatidylglycerophosphate synthase
MSERNVAAPDAVVATRTRATAVLVVVPPSAETAAVMMPGPVVGGLPSLRRIVLTAAAAGYGTIAVAGPDAGIDNVLRGTGATRRAAAGVVANGALCRVVMLPANVLPRESWLRFLAETPIERDTVLVDASMTMVIETADAERVIEATNRCATVEALATDLRRVFAQRPWVLDPDGHFVLCSTRDVRRADTWLLRGLVKQREGFMSRHVERRISLAVTRRLARTRVTPNVITVVSAAIGLAGAPFFLSQRPLAQLVGALLLLTHSIIDGCDGELARLKFLQSRLGAVLDFWADNVVHVVIFAGIAIGWSLAIGAVWPLGLGAIAAAATLGAAMVMFERTASDRRVLDGPRAATLVDGLASRDFIYLLVLASAFGKATWFLALVAVGTPLYAVLAVWLDLRRGRPR